MQFNQDDIVLYPTDTVYGLGVDATNSEMVEKLKNLKGRGDDKHISIAVSGVEMLREYAEVTPLAEKLIEKFLPGKLTLVLKPKDSINAIENVQNSNVQNPGSGHLGLASELGTDSGEVGVRIPAHEKTLELIQEFGKPITATSANVTGKLTENSPDKILEQFGDKSHQITQVIDVGELPPSGLSTVVDARGEIPIILREGAVSEVAILKSVS